MCVCVCVCVCCAFVGLDNKLYIMQGTHIKIMQYVFLSSNLPITSYFSPKKFSIIFGTRGTASINSSVRNWLAYFSTPTATNTGLLNTRCFNKSYIKNLFLLNGLFLRLTIPNIRLFLRLQFNLYVLLVTVYISLYHQQKRV